MDFSMDLDMPSRKRCRREADFDDFEAPVAKKTRQFDASATARDGSAPHSPSDTTYSSPASTPASMDEDVDMFANWVPTQSRGTIISGWNQARRSETEMRQKFPWLYSS
ncbi:hypothetical protein QBC47DRAFT_410623 [Echria macrotheca]|uniref:Uncharacterized protein n=1 Tax=Echria macrotheca TaxID=438768 RepID=A0AAJ0BMS6_9PEZI|nr:hypothetical protein QBC47DRAFT_410623 [Echria macrotheca]